MKIIEYTCRNYKPFREETEIQVKPLTLIFGKNNSGKSAALRLPRLLLRALSSRVRGNFPLFVDEITYGGKFRDLIHGGLSHGDVSFGIVVEVEGQRLDLGATVQNIFNIQESTKSAAETNIVSRLRIANSSIDLRWDPGSGPIGSFKGYGYLPFRGLLPETRGLVNVKAEWGLIDEWRERIELLEDRLSHLGPVRCQIPRLLETGVWRDFGFDGAGTLSYVYRDSELLERVAVWFEKHMEGWRLSMDSAGSAYHCVLRRGSIVVNLADSGQGIQQVFPIVVQQLMRQLRGEESFVDLVEQPELHLHAAAQAPLGDLFLETAKQGHGQVLVETHSENLLLRIRRRVAEGADPNLIALYYVSEHPEGYSSIKRIYILEDGSVDWWPNGVFSEGYEEVKAWRRAARARTVDTAKP
ncbi:MAG: AAA family ATPase [Methylococcales bacterium]